MKEIKACIANNSYLDVIFTRYQDENCSKRFLCQEIAKTINQYVIKAREDEIINCPYAWQENGQLERWSAERISQLKKSLTQEE
jgi:hypothetical protein